MELRIHLPKVDLKLDPHKMEDAYSMMIVSQLYRGLLRFSPTGDVVPDLANSWTESFDRMSYRFKLKDATFSNGKPITAKNVQMSIARIFALGSGMAADLDYIKGVKEFIKSKNINDLGIKVISPNEVEFQLSYPSALFLKHIAVADCAVMPFESVETLTESPSAFSGPYKIENQTSDETDLIKWRADTLQSKTPPEKIVFFKTSEAPLTLASEGKTDSLDRDTVSASERKELEAQGWGASPTELTSETFIVLNPKILSEKLRQYLYSKIDSTRIIEILGEPKFKASYGLIPTNFPGELSVTDLLPTTKEDHKYNGKKTSFQFDYDPSSDVEKKIADYVKTVWSSDLIEVKLNPLSKSEKLQRMFSKTSDAVLGRKAVDYPDGFSVLTYFKGKYDSNYFFVDDPVIDDAIAGAVKEFDAVKRSTIYKKIELQILDKHTYIPIFFGSQASGLWSGKVREVPSHPMGYHTMPFETIEMSAR